jgi:hypothetical protein
MFTKSELDRVFFVEYHKLVVYCVLLNPFPEEFWSSYAYIFVLQALNICEWHICDAKLTLHPILIRRK